MIKIQITAGSGPAECAYVVARLLQAMEVSAKSKAIALNVQATVALNSSRPTALQSAIVELKGEGVDDFAAEWLGTILWVGQSPYRPHHKRKNWYVAVHRMELKSSNQPKGARITFEAMRSQGPGGQNVNKTNSAVRATHVETGITVSSRESRSLVQNRKNAEAKIKAILQNQKNDLDHDNEDKSWRQQMDVNRGNPVKTFRGSEFREVAPS